MQRAFRRGDAKINDEFPLTSTILVVVGCCGYLQLDHQQLFCGKQKKLVTESVTTRKVMVY